MDITPATGPLANFDAVAEFERRASQPRDLNTSLVYGALTLAVDDGREDQRGLDSGVLGGCVEDVVVYGAGRVFANDILDLG